MRREEEGGIIITHCVPGRVSRSTHGRARSFTLLYSTLPDFGPSFSLCIHFAVVELPVVKFPTVLLRTPRDLGHSFNRIKAETKDPRTKKSWPRGIIISQEGTYVL